MYPSVGMEDQRRIGDPGYFRSLGTVVWSLISSPGVMVENCQGHLVKCWVSFPSCGDGARVWGLSHPLKLVGFVLTYSFSSPKVSNTWFAFGRIAETSPRASWKQTGS